MPEPETMVFRFHSGQSLRASIDTEAPLYYNLRDTAGNPLVVSKDRVREIVPLADVEPCPDAFSGAATDPGHSWDGDACTLCGKSRNAAPVPMSAFDRLSRICGPQVPPELLAELAAHRAEVRAEAFTEAADHMAWALKDTPEYGPWVAEQLRAMASPAAAPVPVKTAGDETGEEDECTCMPHRKLRCGHCAMDICEDCHNCPCGCDCAEGGE